MGRDWCICTIFKAQPSFVNAFINGVIMYTYHQMAHWYSCLRFGTASSRTHRDRARNQVLIQLSRPLLQSCFSCSEVAVHCYSRRRNPSIPESLPRPAYSFCRSGFGHFPLVPGLRNKWSCRYRGSGSRAAPCDVPHNYHPATSLWNSDSAPKRQSANSHRSPSCQKFPGFLARCHSPIGTTTYRRQSAGEEQNKKQKKNTMSEMCRFINWKHSAL